MIRDCIYLVSSSSSSEYVMDCLEALALPRGMIQHFRYRLRYIDERLRVDLPKETDKLPRHLQGISVVVVYLNQVQTVGKWKPVDDADPSGPYLPIRYGRLIHAFIDGEIAHFYFEVNDYVKRVIGRISSRVLVNREIAFVTTNRKGADASFCHLAKDLELAAPHARDAEAFQDFVDNAYQRNEWRTRSLGSAPLDVTYDIVFMRIVGVFKQNGERLVPLTPTPKRVQGSVFAEYEMVSGATYHLKINTHLAAKTPSALPGQGRA